MSVGKDSVGGSRTVRWWCGDEAADGVRAWRTSGDAAVGVRSQRWVPMSRQIGHVGKFVACYRLVLEFGGIWLMIILCYIRYR